MEETLIAHPIDKISIPQELVTTQSATRAGFVALALERNVRATPLVEQARSLHAIAVTCKQPTDLLQIRDIQKALLAAAGVSDKSAKHYDANAKSEAVREFTSKFLETAGDYFADELAYRFLLTRGDGLGGSMRNIGGKLGQRKFSRALIGMLRIKDMPISCRKLQSAIWLEMTEQEVADVDITGLSWNRAKQPRTLIYNASIPISGVNVDLCLLSCRNSQWKDNLNQPSQFLALGELKGGIDPAGAYEHWATSRTAISKSRAAFAVQEAHPQTFFVSAAITQTVAQDIMKLNGQVTLTNAANLTNDEQLASLCDWLTTI